MGHTGVRARIVLTALALGALVAGFVAAPAASAAHRYTATVRVHVTKTVLASVRASVAVTASATAGAPPVEARATVQVSATGTGRATRTGWGTARRSAGTRAQAHLVARRAARAQAVRHARANATALARSRALSAARAQARVQAESAAQRAAESKARTLAGLPSTPPAGCTSLPKSGGGTWTCTFDEEFNGTKLDSTKWAPVTTDQTTVTGGAACFVDSPDNISVGGGVLTLTARKTSSPVSCRTRSGELTTSYTGGQVATSGKFAQTYGRFAVRAKFPATTIAGLQSSLWMWPQDSLASGLSGEIDIAEEYSQYADRVIPYLHYAYDPSTVQVTSTNPLVGTNIVTNTGFLVKDVNAFHEYAVEWTASTITILIDGRIVLVDHLAPLGASPFNQPFFLALSACLGLGSNGVTAQTPLPATTQIDWVRAWK